MKTCSVKVKRWKTEATDWEKIFLKHFSDKGLVSEMSKELLKFNNKTSNTIKNGQKILTHTSPKKIDDN